MEKVENMKEKIGNVSKGVETLRKKKKVNPRKQKL